MKWRRVLKLLLMTVFLIGNSLSIQSETNQSVNNKSVEVSRFQIGLYKTEALPVLSLIPHEPMYIVSDDNFTDFGFLGYGNSTHPYIIENYYINDTWEGIAILVKDTTMHFQIRNCYLNTESYGISIDNVGNGTASIINNYFEDSAGIYLLNATGTKISDNTCTIGTAYGIEAAGSNHLEIKNNTCTYFHLYGIKLFDCNYSLIMGNNCSFNQHVGIHLSYSYFLEVYDNTCKFNNYYSTQGSGIKMSRCNFSTIFGNLCENTGTGLRIYSSQEILVLNNTFNYNYYLDGISSYDSISCILANNTFYMNNYGIRLEINNSVIKFNHFQENVLGGVLMRLESFNNIIFHNYFLNNNINDNGKRTSQAGDNSQSNVWYNIETRTGNWWSDLGVRRKYRIEGDAEVYDIYPINKVKFTLDKILTAILVPAISIIVLFLIVKFVKPNLRR